MIAARAWHTETVPSALVGRLHKAQLAEGASLAWEVGTGLLGQCGLQLRRGRSALSPCWGWCAQGL